MIVLMRYWNWTQCSSRLPIIGVRSIRREPLQLSLCLARELYQNVSGLLTACDHCIGPEPLQHRDFIAGLEFGAAQAVLPSLQRQLAAFYLLKSQLTKELRCVSKRENRVELMLVGFPFQRFYN